MANFKTSVGARHIRGQTIAQSGATRDIRAITRNFEKFYSSLEEVTVEALYEAMKPIFEESQRQCPVDTGKLKGSGYLVIRHDLKEPTVDMGYARAGDPSYAVFVHEDLEMHHKAPTKAKFLEDPLKDGEGEILARVADYIKGKMF